MPECRAIEAAQRAGFDLSLIEDNLRGSYEKRALQHQAALELALELTKIGQQMRGESLPLPDRFPAGQLPSRSG